MHAQMAEENFRSAGLDGKVRVLKGTATTVLRRLRGSYDFVFEDSTYGRKPAHYTDLVRILRVGGLVQFANWSPIEPAILGGKHLDKFSRGFPGARSAAVATRRFIESVSRDRRLSLSLVPFSWRGLAVKVRN